MATISNIFIDQDADFTTTVTVNDSSGDALDLAGYTALTMIRKTYQSATAVNMFIAPSLGPSEITLEAGNVIAYLTPLQHDVKIELETKWVPEEEWRSLMKHHFTFDGFYRKTKKWLDRNKK